LSQTISESEKAV